MIHEVKTYVWNTRKSRFPLPVVYFQLTILYWIIYLSQIKIESMTDKLQLSRLNHMYFVLETSKDSFILIWFEYHTKFFMNYYTYNYGNKTSCRNLKWAEKYLNELEMIVVSRKNHEANHWRSNCCRFICSMSFRSVFRISYFSCLIKNNNP